MKPWSTMPSAEPGTSGAAPVYGVNVGSRTPPTFTTAPGTDAATPGVDPGELEVVAATAEAAGFTLAEAEGAAAGADDAAAAGAVVGLAAGTAVGAAAGA